MAPYDCWEKFIEEARNTLSIFLKESSLKNIIRTAVRFINRFDFPGSSVELSDYLSI
ncbi:MAG: TIGR04255 family protein, partial [Verrucomicrobia bacterium]|nr:TIGR04255 family protein [Verrucomicrobiota bacterium]